jgi:hypothetical protein
VAGVAAGVDERALAGAGHDLDVVLPALDALDPLALAQLERGALVVAQVVVDAPLRGQQAAVGVGPVDVDLVRRGLPARSGRAASC